MFIINYYYIILMKLRFRDNFLVNLRKIPAFSVVFFIIFNLNFKTHIQNFRHFSFIENFFKINYKSKNGLIIIGTINDAF